MPAQNGFRRFFLSTAFLATASLASFLLPMNSHSADGLWLSDQAQGFFFYTVEGELAQVDTLILWVNFPNRAGWAVFSGPKIAGPNDAFQLSVASATPKSDLSGRWVLIDENEAEFVVLDCSFNCPFEFGDTLRFTRVFGSGLDPLTPPAPDILPGTWENSDGSACLNVARDGTQLVSAGSECESGATFAFDVNGTDIVNSNAPCTISASSRDVIAIAEDRFSFSYSPGAGTTVGVQGEFESASLVSGTLTETRIPPAAEAVSVCFANWTASPLD